MMKMMMMITTYLLTCRVLLTASSTHNIAAIIHVRPVLKNRNFWKLLWQKYRII